MNELQNTPKLLWNSGGVDSSSFPIKSLYEKSRNRRLWQPVDSGYVRSQRFSEGGRMGLWNLSLW